MKHFLPLHQKTVCGLKTLQAPRRAGNASTICFAAVGDVEDVDDKDIVFDGIDDAVFADAVGPFAFKGEL